MGLKLKSTNGTGSVELNAPDNHNINTSFTLPTSNFTGGEWVLADGNGNVNIDSGTLYVDAVNDRVGIGTASPAYNAHFTNSGAAGTLSLHGSSGVGYLLMGNVDTSSGPTVISSANHVLAISRGDSFSSAGGGTLTESVRIDSAGNVGIGTTSPINALHINGAAGGTASRLRLSSTEGSGFTIRSESATETMLNVDSSENLLFGVGGGERSRLTSAGFSKHTNTGTYGSTIANYHEFNSNVGNSAICQFFHRSTSNPYGLIIRFTDAAPDNNSVYFINCVDNSNAVRFKVWSDGDCDNHDNSYGSTSDEKLKQDIVDATSQWDDIKDLRIRKFKFKSDVEAYGDEAKTLIGVVAQEAETVSPGLIKNNPDLDDEGNDLGTVTKSVRYSVLYMKAVKALQEAMQRIETLETQNASFEARLAALEGGTTE